MNKTSLTVLLLTESLVTMRSDAVLALFSLPLPIYMLLCVSMVKTGYTSIQSFPLNQGLSTCNNNNNKVMQVHGH